MGIFQLEFCLQDRNNLLLDGRTVENKGKLMLYLCTVVYVCF
jgi:hypothetical protein